MEQVALEHDLIDLLARLNKVNLKSYCTAPVWLHFIELHVFVYSPYSSVALAAFLIVFRLLSITVGYVCSLEFQPFGNSKLNETFDLSWFSSSAIFAFACLEYAEEF